MRTLFKRSLLAAAIAVSVAACGSSSSGGSGDADTGAAAETASTTFNVAVDAPDSLQQVAALDWDQKLSRFFFPAAMAVDGDDLSAENFTVVVVDAQGNVVEEVTISAENITKNPDGTWQISVPGDPRLDCLIVVDINKPVQISVGSGIPADALYAPTTAVEIDVDVASTSAYQNFIEELAATPGQTFEDLGLDVDNPEDVAAVEAVVEKVQEIFEQLVSGGDVDLTVGSLEQMLAAADAKVEEIIEQEVANVVNATTGTIAELMSSGGLFWYDGEFDKVDNTTNLEVDELEYGYISATGVETFTEYDDETMDWADSETFSPGDTAGDDRVLTSGGWAHSADAFKVAAINGDDSVTIQDAALSFVQETVSAAQVTSLEGRNIEDFMGISSGSFGQIIESDKVFAAGAKAYRLAFTNVNDVYTLWFDIDTKDNGDCEYRSGTPNALGGNCETAARIVDGSYEESTDLLDNLIVSSAIDAAVSETGFVGTVIAHLDNTDIILAELVADKTVNFYLFSSGETNTYTKLTSASWSYQTPTGLGEGEQIVVVPLPDAVLAKGDFDRDERTFIFAKDQEYIRKGNFVAAGTASAEADDWVFNSVANGNILAAVDFDFLDALEVTGNSQSEWDDNAYDGFGGPVVDTEYTYKAYDRTVTLARNSADDLDLTEGTFSGVKYYDTGDFATANDFMMFNANGTGTSSEEDRDSVVETHDFTWSVNEDGYLSVNFDVTESGDSDTSYSLTASDTFAKISGDGDTLQLKAFFQNSLWQQIGPDVVGDPVVSVNQGEIWETTWSTNEPQLPQ